MTSLPNTAGRCCSLLFSCTSRPKLTSGRRGTRNSHHRLPRSTESLPMYFDYTPARQELRREIRSCSAGLLTPEVREAIGGTSEDLPAYREIVRQIGRDGWVGLGWPTEFGGQGCRPDNSAFWYRGTKRHLPAGNTHRRCHLGMPRRREMSR